MATKTKLSNTSRKKLAAAVNARMMKRKAAKEPLTLTAADPSADTGTHGQASVAAAYQTEDTTLALAQIQPGENDRTEFPEPATTEEAPQP